MCVLISVAGELQVLTIIIIIIISSSSGSGLVVDSLCQFVEEFVGEICE